MNLRDMQLDMVSMMETIDHIFMENNIHYVLLGGSVLGAIRHKGFIPWDDDIDIGVLRKDFNKAESLLSELKPYCYESSEHHIIPDAPIGHLHLVNELYKIENSPTIDIFALDNVPSDIRERKRLSFWAMLHHLTVLRKPPIHRGKLKKFLTSLFLWVVPNYVLNKLQNYSLKKILTLKIKSNIQIGNIWGEYFEKEYFEPEVYLKVERRTFESLELPIPQEYDKYLTQLYGDYMKLPPIEKRVPKHKKI